MPTATIKTRIANRTDTTANWDAKTEFVPLKGELIIYQDEGQPTRYKIGDGTTLLSQLSFLAETSGLTIEEVFSEVYPIGAIYISVNSASPASLFGGTWERIQDCFLLSAGSTYGAGTTGGEAKHTLTYKELPATTGSITMHNASYGTNVAGVGGCFTASYVNDGIYRHGGTLLEASTSSVGKINYSNGGANQAHNNMPPYLAVYMWKRVS